jgi:exodeoxyribonuclease VII large subunit
VTEDRALSVTEAMGRARRALESLTLRVIGEVSDATDKPGYKAIYFTLGDGASVMSCLAWRDVYTASGVQLRLGMLLEVSGSLTVYAPKGRMQFVCRTLAPAGEGVLRMQVAAVARALAAEGLMREERKRALPVYPRRIGLVTSPRGKAVHDVIRTLRRRYPAAELVVAGVAVEGAGAVSGIVRGLDAMYAADVDVVILARGGGSYEDMMPFNAEEVARAIVRSPVPVVTGIGHEPDTSIADMVADVRASTPTAAAEAVSCAYTELVGRIGQLSRRLARGLLHNTQAASHSVSRIAERRIFREPDALLGPHALRVDAAAEGLGRALPLRLERDTVRIIRADEELRRLGGRITERPEDRLALAAARLEDLSPLSVLKRGYAVCYDATGARVVRSSEELNPGDRVRVRLERGRADCTVDTVEAEA